MEDIHCVLCLVLVRVHFECQLLVLAIDLIVFSTESDTEGGKVATCWILALLLRGHLAEGGLLSDGKPTMGV